MHPHESACRRDRETIFSQEKGRYGEAEESLCEAKEGQREDEGQECGVQRPGEGVENGEPRM